MTEEKYVVRSKSWMRFVCWFGFVMFFLLFAFVVCQNLIYEEKEPLNTILFEACIGLFFIVLCAKGIYDERRPRIEVCGEELTVYPRRKKKRTIRFSDITSRRTGFMNAPPSVFGAVGFAVNGGRGSTFYTMSYYTDGGLVIEINTRMKNADRFDKAVMHRLDG